MSHYVLPSAFETNLVPRPADAPGLRWGILGAGNIARTLAKAVTERTASEIVAVGSRGTDKAQAFINQELGSESGAIAYGSYEDLVNAPDVDVIYVATPHSHHLEHALLAVNAGKHVLVEKAFARNAQEAQQVFDAAKQQGVFVMEAMWTRFLPHVAALRDLIRHGEIGTVTSVIAEHGYLFPYDPESRIHNINLAGGALLDLGVYPISFAHDLLGMPERIMALGSLTQDGVDGQISIALGYPEHDGVAPQAHLHTTITGSTENAASIVGTLGRIDLPPGFFGPSGFVLNKYNGESQTYEQDNVLGFEFQVAEVARRISAGFTESGRLPWRDTLEVMEIMDNVRVQIGLVYPGEPA